MQKAKFVLSLVIYLLGAALAVFLQRKYRSFTVTGLAIVIVYSFAWFAKKIDSAIEYKFTRPVKHGWLVFITFVIVAILLFVFFLYVPSALSFVAKVISPLGKYIP